MEHVHEYRDLEPHEIVRAGDRCDPYWANHLIGEKAQDDGWRRPLLGEELGRGSTLKDGDWICRPGEAPVQHPDGWSAADLCFRPGPALLYRRLDPDETIRHGDWSKDNAGISLHPSSPRGSIGTRAGAAATMFWYRDIKPAPAPVPPQRKLEAGDILREGDMIDDSRSVVASVFVGLQLTGACKNEFWRPQEPPQEPLQIAGARGTGRTKAALDHMFAALRRDPEATAVFWVHDRHFANSLRKRNHHRLGSRRVKFTWGEIDRSRPDLRSRTFVYIDHYAAFLALRRLTGNQDTRTGIE